jgi:hypothetical protein
LEFICKKQQKSTNLYKREEVGKEEGERKREKRKGEEERKREGRTREKKRDTSCLLP